MFGRHLTVTAQEGYFCEHPTVHRAAPTVESVSALAHKGLPPNWSHRSGQGETETPPQVPAEVPRPNS